MTADDAIEIINGDLNIGAGITVQGDTIKCWTVSTEGPDTDKTYFGESDCLRLSLAFGALAVAQRQGKAEKP